MPRKTVSVQDVREHANFMLALEDGQGTPGTPNRTFRQGIIAMVTRVLHDTDNYKGFQYLPDQFYVEDLPGGSRRVLREDYDDTRVKFY